MMFISFIEIHKCYDVTGEATKSCNWPAVLPVQHDWSGLTVFLRRGARRPECSGRITSRPGSLFLISWPRWLPSLPSALTPLCRSNVRPPLESQLVQDGDRWPKSGPGVRRFLIRVSSCRRRPGLPSRWIVTDGTTSAIQRFALDDLRAYATSPHPEDVFQLSPIRFSVARGCYSTRQVDT